MFLYTDNVIMGCIGSVLRSCHSSSSSATCLHTTPHCVFGGYFQRIHVLLYTLCSSMLLTVTVVYTFSCMHNSSYTPVVMTFDVKVVDDGV